VSALPWPRYSFRAETARDVVTLLDRLLGESCQFRVERWTTTPYGECHLEVTTPLTLAALRFLANGVEDGHVMAETLRLGPLLENTLERA
jgi:hypothetical protein